MAREPSPPPSRPTPPPDRGTETRAVPDRGTETRGVTVKPPNVSKPAPPPAPPAKR